jgi:hypothetical protein
MEPPCLARGLPERAFAQRMIGQNRIATTELTALFYK